MQKTYHKKEVPELAREKCGVIYALELIGGKWKLPVLWKLSKQDTIRYNELRRQLPGVTNTMLTRVLVDLEANGLVVRREYEQVPPHVEYSLTDLGRSLVPLLGGMCDWGKRYLREVRGVELPMCEKTGRILHGKTGKSQPLSS